MPGRLGPCGAAVIGAVASGGGGVGPALGLEAVSSATEAEDIAAPEEGDEGSGVAAGAEGDAEAAAAACC